MVLRMIVMTALFLAPFQQKKAVEIEDMPTSRIDDTYTVYNAALRHAIWDHTDTSHYFVADHTAQTYGVDDPEKCIKAPEAYKQQMDEAAADFVSQKKKSYRLAYLFDVPGKEVRLVNSDEEKQIVDHLFRGKPIDDPKLTEAGDIVRLSPVGFSHDGKLAIMVVSNYCGGLCGGEKWRVFARAETTWKEQQWGSCFIISRAGAITPHGDALALTDSSSR